MLIDWFTVGAQVINFLVLVWLLKRFLYQPILQAIDTREQRIATELSDADHKRAEAVKQGNAFKQKNAEFDEQKVSRMNQLTLDTEAERNRLLDIVRQDAADLRVKLQGALKNEQQSLQDALNRCAREEVFEITRKVLKDLAGTSLEEQITAVFIQRLRSLDNEDLLVFKSAFTNLKDGGAKEGIAKESIKEAMIVRSAFALPKEQCALIKSAVKAMFYDDISSDDEGRDITLKFVTDSDVVSGIELSANGQKVAWSINHYLDSLEKAVDQILQNSIHKPSTEQSTERSAEKSTEQSDEKVTNDLSSTGNSEKKAKANKQAKQDSYEA